MRKIVSLFLVIVLCLPLAGCGGKNTPPEDIKDPKSGKNTDDPEEVEPSPSENEEGIKTVTAGPEDLVALVTNAEDRFWGYINTRGQWVIAPDYLAGTQFSKGLAAVLTRGKDSHWQIINKTGAVQADCGPDIQFVAGASFCEGLMQIQTAPGWGAGHGFADTRGQVVAPPVYQEVRDFQEGLAAVKKDGLWGYIDTRGNEVIPCQFSVGHSFSCGRAYVCYEVPPGIFKDGDAFIDKTGKIIFEDIGVGSERLGFEQFSSDFQNGVALCLCLNDRTIGRGVGLVNDAGAIVWYDREEKFSLPSTYRLEGENLFPVTVRESNQEGFIDTAGNLVCTVPEGYHTAWEESSGFKGGLCLVKEKNSGLLGYLNKSGQVVIAAKYQDATPFCNGYAAVSEDWSSYFYIDSSGKAALSGNFTCQGKPFTR